MIGGLILVTVVIGLFVFLVFDGSRKPTEDSFTFEGAYHSYWLVYGRLEVTVKLRRLEIDPYTYADRHGQLWIGEKTSVNSGYVGRVRPIL